MADFVASTRNTMIDWLIGKTTPATVATRYITIFNGDPQGAGSEVINTVTGSSNRIDLTTPMGTASAGSATNSSVITFTSSASGAATVDYVAIYDAQTAGNLLASAAATASKSVTSGDSLTIAASGLTVSIT